MVASVVNVVVRKDLEQQIATATSLLGEREAHYIARKSEIDGGYAREHGFVAVETARYVTRAPLAQAR